MRRRTRRRLVGLALAGAGLAAVRYRDQVPDVSPAAAYVRSGQWHGIALLLLAAAASWLAWRLFLLAVTAMRQAWGLRPGRFPVGANRRTSLYRWYSTPVPGGQALYIGIAFNPGVRAGQHSRSQPWWWKVRSCTVEWFDTRAEALEQEKRAIEREHPIHNDIHNGRRRPAYARTGRGAN